MTKATLAADARAVTAAGAAVRASVNAAKALYAADAKAIAADLKPVVDALAKKTNAGLVKTLKADEARLVAALKADATKLVNAGTQATKRAAADAAALIAKPKDPKLGAKVAADASALGLVSVAPLAKLQADAQRAGLNTDLANLLGANPAVVPLAGHVQAAQAHVASTLASLASSATAFSATLGTVSTDSSAAATASSIVGKYNGNTIPRTGSNIGHVMFLELDVDDQQPDGSIVGGAILDTTTELIGFTMTGRVTAADAFTATLTDTKNPGRTITLTAIVHRNVAGNNGPETVLDGTYAGTGGIDSGTVTVTT